MTKSELLELVDSLGITTEYYCDNGRNQGKFRLIMTNPYVRTDLWDLLLEEMKPEEMKPK